MRTIRMTAFVSLDGVMQAPGAPDEDPTGGFAFGGWVAPFWDDTLDAAVTAAFARPFDLLLGRKTYDIFAAHWPHAGDDGVGAESPDAGIAARFNAAAKHVASRREPRLDWANSHWLGVDAVAGLVALTAGEGPDLLIQGSGDFVQSLMAAELIDEITLLTFPVLLGGGKRLFGAASRPATFALIHSAVSPGGVVIASYRRAGAVRTGSFATDPPSAAELVRRRGLE